MLMRRCGVGFGALLKKALTTMKRRMFGTQKGKGMQDTRCERGVGEEAVTTAQHTREAW